MENTIEDNPICKYCSKPLSNHTEDGFVTSNNVVTLDIALPLCQYSIRLFKPISFDSIVEGSSTYSISFD